MQGIDWRFTNWLEVYQLTGEIGYEDNITGVVCVWMK